MTRLGVSAVVITFNEEERLRDCLESLAWADELIVVDAESSDKTVQIAREFTDRVWVRPWPGFPDQKNFASSGDLPRKSLNKSVGLSVRCSAIARPSYSLLRGSTLTIAAPGVLSNDNDPHGLPLTVVLISGP